MSKPASSHDLVDIVERLPEERPALKTIIREVDYPTAVKIVRYLDRPGLDLRYVETGKFAYGA